MLDAMPYPSPEADARLARIATRKVGHAGDLETRVAEILEAVRRDGDAALIRYTRQFDAPDAELADLGVDEAEVDAAYAVIAPDFLDILRRAIDNIRAFHEPQRPQSWFTTRPDGSILGQMVRPVAAAGLYIPGGKGGETPLISSVLMNGIPARIAGVQDIALVTPPRRDGSTNPHLLVAAREVGVTRIHRLGSAWAIGALAYGTASVKRVDVVVGPGNIYVTLAKKIVAGEVGIDMLAGPSEILVVADEFANPNHIAADLLSQAEHDPMASAVLITTSAELARAVSRGLNEQLAHLPRAEVAREALRQYGALFTVQRLDDALRLSNTLAPEHLELQLRDPWPWLAKVQHAGAVFL
ncbi:MAG TPA: histidinol dehydrogenase, partial [Syntrophobacteraceae bacterium]|nr:histidinol dehydrogenase [Syntrophobacteraceae bacterium]